MVAKNGEEATPNVKCFIHQSCCSLSESHLAFRLLKNNLPPLPDIIITATIKDCCQKWIEIRDWKLLIIEE